MEIFFYDWERLGNIDLKIFFFLIALALVALSFGLRKAPALFSALCLAYSERRF